MIRRFTLKSETHVLDEKSGLVEFVASDQSVGSDSEIVKASGWRFDSFQKNSPFVDSHNYSSIEHKLGEVVDWKVQNNRLIETVKWLHDVPEHRLAMIGWKMTLAGMPPAVSVGFLPIRAVSRKSARSAWADACLSVGQDPNKTTAARICLEQEQKELSAVIIGANANAVAKAYSAGIITDADREKFWSVADFREETRRVYSFGPSENPPTQKTMSRQRFLEKLSASTGLKPALESLEQARKGRSEGELLRSVGAVRRAQFSIVQRSAHAHIAALLSDPQTRFELTAECKAMVKQRLNPDEAKHVESIKQKAMSEATVPGAILMSTLLCQTILELTPLFGAYRTLGVLTMPTGTTKFARATVEPAGVWYSRAQQPDNLASDVVMTGASLSGQAGSLIVYIEVSDELLQDAGVDITTAVLTRCAAGLAGGLDNASFAGTGADDGTSGAQTGIFPAVVTNTANAAAGNTSADKLQREDFLAQAAQVNGAALQRGCRYWVNPAFLPLLMTIKSGTAGYLVKTPLDNDGEEWSLNGFPMSLTTAAPGVLTPGSTVCAFGHGPAYNVGIRDELEFKLGLPKFNSALHAFRAIARARCDMVDETWFSLLKLAAQ